MKKQQTSSNFFESPVYKDFFKMAALSSLIHAKNNLDESIHDLTEKHNKVMLNELYTYQIKHTTMEQQILIAMPIAEFTKLLEDTVRKVINEKNIEEDKLLTSEEVMILLNISTTTLQTWRDKKKIPFQKMGNKIFYSKNQLLKSLNIIPNNKQ